MPNRHTKSRGTVYKTGSTWRGSISYNDPQTKTKKRQYFYGHQKQDVLRKMDEFKQHLQSMRELPEGSHIDTKEYLEKWLTEIKRRTLRDTTFRRYEILFNKHVFPHVKGKPLGTIDAVAVLNLLSAMEAHQASPRNVQLAYVVLKTAFKDAVRLGHLSVNPFSNVDKPKFVGKTMHPLTDEQMTALAKATAGEPLHAFYVLAMTTGMRFGELAGLKWSEVDLAAGHLLVKHTLIEIDGKFKLGEPKTKRGRRRVELGKQVVAVLKEHKKANPLTNSSDDWVFATEKGERLSRDRIAKDHFRRMLKKAGLPKVRFHDLRHSHATSLLKAGVDA